MTSSRKLPHLLLFFLLAVVAAVHAAAAAPVPVPAPAQEYCGDTLAGLTACGSFVFGGAEAPSPACCAAFAAVYASGESLCLCYLDDGTFWSAVGYGGGAGGDYANVTAGDDSSFLIPDGCGQVGRPPIAFRCEESGPEEIPPYGPQGSPAQPPAISAGGGGPPTARPPSECGPEEIPPYGPQSTPAAQPPTTAGAGAPTAQPPSAHSVDVVASTAKTKRGSSPELLMLLLAVAALCSIV